MGLRVSLVLGLALAVAASGWAQGVGAGGDKQPKAPKVINDQLNGQDKTYEHKMVKGKTYVIEQMSGDFDSMLFVRDKNGQTLAEDDDGGEGLNSKIVFRTPATGTYTIVASSFGGNGQGKFQITIRQEETKPPQATGKVDNANPSGRHEFRLTKGTTYTIDLISREFDTYLKFEDATGKQLAEDDDGGDGLNSRITFTPEETGTYRVIATRFAEQGGGAYELFISPAPEGGKKQ